MVSVAKLGGYAQWLNQILQGRWNRFLFSYRSKIRQQGFLAQGHGPRHAILQRY
jgi:hypothetical protein